MPVSFSFFKTSAEILPSSISTLEHPKMPHSNAAIIFHHFTQPCITPQHCFVAFCSAVIIACNVFRLYSKITLSKVAGTNVAPPHEEHVVQCRVISILWEASIRTLMHICTHAVLRLISGHVPYCLVHLIQTLRRLLVHLKAFRGVLCITKQVHR